MALFDRYVMVDWSAAAAPTTGRDSIWIGLKEPGLRTAVENIPTRQLAVERLKDLCAAATETGHRVLIGFDFPFGYPSGVARHITGRDCALTLWRWIADRLTDGPANTNNRFAVAAEMNRLYPGIGPFWGRPASVDEIDIPIKSRERTKSDHPPERRLADQSAKGAKTVWQLAYAGSVGSQVLTGLPALLALRDDPDIGESVRIWPFETGLSAPETQITLSEIYPSLIPPDASEAIKDAGQVRATADWLATLDQQGRLASHFAGPADATDAQRRAIETEEAWILGLDEIAAKAAKPKSYRYERDPQAIYRQSFAIVRREARLDHVPPDLQETAIRLVHACGIPDITARLAWSTDCAASAKAALRAGAPVLCDCEAVASMVIRRTLPADNPVICTLNDPATSNRAAEIGNTRSAAAVELWGERLGGAVVAIGNAPTALFHLLELIEAGAPRPAALLGFPVGFVGAAESKAALATGPCGVPFLTLRGRRGGSAMAAAAVNALAIAAAGGVQ